MPPPTKKTTSTNATPTLIIDIGQYETKFGTSNLEEPLVQPTVVSFQMPYPNDKKPNFTVGKEAIKEYKLKGKKPSEKTAKKSRAERVKKPTSTDPQTVLRYPYQSGMVMDWDQMEAVFKHCYDNIQVKDKERCGVVVTSDPLSPMLHRQGICELFIELFNCEKFVMEAPGVLEMRRQGNEVLNGLSVSCGASFTSLTPVVNNKPLYQSTTHFPVAGQVLSGYVLDMIKHAGYELGAGDAYRVAQHVKKNMSYTAMDINAELKGLAETPEDYVQAIELPNGESLEIGGEAFKLVETLFNPQLIGLYDDSSLQKSIYDVCQKVNPQDRKLLYSNIVISGGTSLIHDFSTRLTQELKQYLKLTSDDQFAKSVNVNYPSGNAEDESTTGAWLGAKKWTTDDAEGKTKIDWITRKDYEEEGSGRIVLKKCF